MDNVRRVDAPTDAVKKFRESEELDAIARKLKVPTNDDDVRKTLRDNGFQVELPNETKFERRQRLIKSLSSQKRDNPDSDDEDDLDEHENAKTIFIPESTEEGSDDLLKARQQINKFVEQSRANYKPITNINFDYDGVEMYGSQSGFKRFVSGVRIVPNTDEVVVADWAGMVSVLSLNDEMTIHTQKQLTGVGTRLSKIDMLRDMLCVGTDIGKVVLLKYQNKTVEEISVLNAHESRVSSVCIHPCEQFLMSASYDKTWKLWDIEANKEVLCQRGHTDSLNCIKTNYEGSVVATGASDKLLKVWDLRSGVQALSSDEHGDGVMSVTFQNNTVLASAGTDNVICLHDLRNLKEPVKRIYAHTHTITDLKFTNSHIVSASLDGFVKFWNINEFKLDHSVNLYASRMDSILAIDLDAKNNLVAGKQDRSVTWCKKC